MSYYKKAKLYAIICAVLVVVAAVLVVTVGLPEKAPFVDNTVLTVKCVDIPLDFTKLDTQLASATDLSYTVTQGKDLAGSFEAANVVFNGTGFTTENAQALVSTLGASYSVLSLNTINGKSASGLTMYMVFTGIVTFLIAGIYLAFRYGFKTALTAFVPAFAAAAAALITTALIGAGFSYPLAVAVIGSFALALFFAALAFGQARELHETKHVHDHDDVADQTGAALMPRNIGIAVVSVLILGAMTVIGFVMNIPSLSYTALPLLIGILVGLFGAQLCAVPLCNDWQNAEEAAVVKKAHEKKPAKSTAKSTAKTPAKSADKATAKKAPSKKTAKKSDSAKTSKPATGKPKSK